MGRGTAHAPKPDDQRRRRNAPASGPEQVLVRDGELRGPELAPDRPWVPQTLEWYETWRRSPQAAIFENTDWFELRMLAQLVDDFWMSGGDLKLSAEIRMRQERLGWTVTDRQRARMRITDAQPGQGQQPGVTGNAIDARARFARGA